WVVGLHRDSMQRVVQTVELLADVNRYEQKFGVVQVMASLKNAGDSQLFRKNHIAQFLDGVFLFFALGVLQFLNAVEDLAEIAWRINCNLVAHRDSEFSRQLNPKHR